MSGNSKKRQVVPFIYSAERPVFIEGATSRQADPLNSLLALIFRLTGFNARAYRDSTLKRRLELRLQATRCRKIKEYLAYIKNHPEEAFIFKENLLIHVTRFFRDRPVFTYFEQRLLPGWLNQLMASKRRRIRIWSVGCASGQEPFTLAMILHRPATERGLHPLILATDISPQVLDKAREALYSASELRYVPRHYRQIYFTEIKPKLFRLTPELRQLVNFRQHDLLQDKAPGKFDLIVCRNLLIFFRPEAQSLLLKKLIQSLNEGGLLLLGRSERINLDSSLELVSSRFCFYRKMTNSKRRKSFFG
ncbi:MAG: protein-glutamate O-methyltransferase CheR [Candidatus Aminicenantes bacterium]|nr:protein-glutamate O-methyltransferase CheR [Candidatus Aminicenantes bacterium]